MVKPFYQDRFVTLYHGDSLELMPEFESGSFSSVITDPVWPNALKFSPRGRREHQRLAPLAGAEDPRGLFARAAAHFPRLTSRVVVIIGCDSDPRFLEVVPRELAYVRTCWLRYAVPTYRGRVLVGSDVAYVFGQPPKSKPGARVLPGEVTFNSPRRRALTAHPCARRQEHIDWVVGWFGGACILDPFAGSGTTLEDDTVIQTYDVVRYLLSFIGQTYEEYVNRDGT